MVAFHLLPVFFTVVETLSFMHTAQRLRVWQPSFSRCIRASERNSGCRPFARNGRNLELTDAGVKLAPLTQEAVLLSTGIESKMASMGNSEAIALTVRTGLGVFISERVVEAREIKKLAIVQTKGIEVERNISIPRNKRPPSTPARSIFCFSPESPLGLCESDKPNLWINRGVYENH
ncbi:MAG: LysR family transcriptional regulator [Anaerolineales bacterium]|nr:LysR family transcriptional regulator [Anaerolineales bacterium]MCS7247717.1 LysR family transcriptional regulator [Anaerolineales bacterium]MDW8161527.1 LysR family transcriptional regulator [Anaerolineales bacterium]MDW8446863.1 LysR family transcriptional regulator [Anaerolineales bacterium]